MPVICEPFGAKICMYYKDHIPPHVHVLGTGFSAVVSIPEGTVVAGELLRAPPSEVRKMRGDCVEAVPHEIRSVYPVGSHHLILEFETGEYRVADVRPFLEGPVFEPLKDLAFFRQVKADPETRTVVWPNGADLCPDVLYAKSVPLKLPEELGA